MQFTVPGWIHWSVMLRGIESQCCHESNWYLADVIEVEDYLQYQFKCHHCDHVETFDDKNGKIRTLKQMQDNLPNVKG